MSSSVQPVGSAGGPGHDPGSVDPAAKPVRRSFTAEYRARVVAEYAATSHGGEVATDLPSHITDTQAKETVEQMRLGYRTAWACRPTARCRLSAHMPPLNRV